MENFENQPGVTMPKINWRKYITKFSVVSLIALILAGAVAYESGWKQQMNNQYQRGLEAGKQEMNAIITQQIQQLYDLGQSINIKVGERTIIFQPVK